MADQEYRQLEREAAAGNPAASLALHRRGLRFGLLREGAQHCLQGPMAMDVAFTPAGHVLTTGWDGVQLWDVKTGQELRRFCEPARAVSWCVALSPDGRYVASAFGDLTTRMWELASGRLIFQRPTQGIAGGLSFSPDGERLLLSTFAKTLHLVDARDGTELNTIHTKTSATRSVAFAPDGRRAVTGGFDKTVRLWDMDRGVEVACLGSHEKYVESVAFAPNGRVVVSAGRDKTVRMWDVELARELGRLEGHKKMINRVALSPTAQRALTASNDGTIRLWDLPSGSEMRCYQGHERAVTSVAFSQDGARAVSGSEDGSVRTWVLPC